MYLWKQIPCLVVGVTLWVALWWTSILSVRNEHRGPKQSKLFHKQIVWAPRETSSKRETSGGLLPGGVLDKVLYGEALPLGLTPYPEKGTSPSPLVLREFTYYFMKSSLSHSSSDAKSSFFYFVQSSFKMRRGIWLVVLQLLALIDR